MITSTITKETLFTLVSDGLTKDFLQDYVLYYLEKNEKGEFDTKEVLEAIEDNEDNIFECADNSVSVYNYDRLEWLKYNYSDFEDYVEEFGIDCKNFSLMQTIGGAMCIQNENILRNDIEELKEKLEEITDGE